MRGGYKYYCLLSGQDYPIKSRQYIQQFLDENYPKPLIDVNEYANEKWLQSKFQEVRFLHKIEDIHNKMKPGILRKLRVAPIVIAEKVTVALFGTPYRRLTKMGCKLYGGSAWWILPDKVVDFTLEQVNKNSKIFRELKKTWTPEETFFQIMTMASPSAHLVQLNSKDLDVDGQNCMTYANFNTPTKSFRGHPHTIEKEDFERIMSKKALFARKFDEAIDKKILDMIDKEISNE